MATTEHIKTGGRSHRVNDVTLFEYWSDADQIARRNNADADPSDRYDVAMAPSKWFAIAVTTDGAFEGFL